MFSDATALGCSDRSDTGHQIARSWPSGPIAQAQPKAAKRPVFVGENLEGERKISLPSKALSYTDRTAGGQPAETPEEPFFADLARNAELDPQRTP